jgi:hypothetical protein
MTGIPENYKSKQFSIFKKWKKTGVSPIAIVTQAGGIF